MVEHVVSEEDGRHVVIEKAAFPWQHVRKLGEDMTVEEGYEAARIAALNCLAVVKSLAGSLDRVERVVKVVGFVNCTPDFEAQPKVINGASELLGQVFGDAGLHARSAVGGAGGKRGSVRRRDVQRTSRKRLFFMALSAR